MSTITTIGSMTYEQLRAFIQDVMAEGLPPSYRQHEPGIDVWATIERHFIQHIPNTPTPTEMLREDRDQWNSNPTS